MYLREFYFKGIIEYKLIPELVKFLNKIFPTASGSISKYSP